jgi:cellulose synthase/poly-beta-1,6-N-acetylglucosamine synthase-like glycosyltransferase
VRRPRERKPIIPSVSIILAAHNEAEVIGSRIENLLALDYPPDKLEIILASDGSDDETVAIAEKYRDRGVVIIDSSVRQGKSAVQNLAASKAKGEVLCFTDADTRFAPDFLRKLVASFADQEVGCATGKLLYTNTQESAISYYAGSIYWRYELAIRERESHLGLLFVASGQCMAIRRDLFQPIPPFSGEDCIVPLDCLLAGRRVVYEPQAVAYDTIISRTENELSSRARMAVRTLHGLWARRALLNPLRHPTMAWAIASHKLCRYAVPFAMIGAFLANLGLLGTTPGRGLLAAQCLFYLAAAAGWRQELRGSANPGLRTGALARFCSFAFSFCVAQIGFLAGIVQALQGRRIIAYAPGE